ncbi:CLUMA_CG001497, isoform A [Clunio marinus]|uniref:CLUMA_CG001497, isoform A n=1 Tax=Clunio marinus TaxID=568069 RepID=A0A1J1HIH8_9DIPT|nr:CLUMA_CG001497, isoform A [Clunio marinus]
MLSTDAHTEQEALLPQPSYGTVKVYTLSLPPAFTYLRNNKNKKQIFLKFNYSLVNKSCSSVTQFNKAINNGRIITSID